MVDWSRTTHSALVYGTCASIAFTAALAVAALMEGKAAVRPINATSHWLNGEEAGSYKGFDRNHTAVGYGTNHATSIFWAMFFELWLSRCPVGSHP
ncbi:MAG: hypothetical protein ACRYG8_33720 [Janthinobacterium lividum]